MGILLDLGAMNLVTLSADQKIASLEPGARWGDVYEVVEKEELTVVGGRTAEVGVGGLVRVLSVAPARIDTHKNDTLTPRFQ